VTKTYPSLTGFLRVNFGWEYIGPLWDLGVVANKRRNLERLSVQLVWKNTICSRRNLPHKANWR